jgi:hypothetical protein
MSGSSQTFAPLAGAAPKDTVQCQTRKDSPSIVDCLEAIENVPTVPKSRACAYNQGVQVAQMARYKTCAVEAWNYDGDARCIAKKDYEKAKWKLVKCFGAGTNKVVMEGAWISGGHGLRFVRA